MGTSAYLSVALPAGIQVIQLSHNLLNGSFHSLLNQQQITQVLLRSQHSNITQQNTAT
jgi:hypothetical protein